MWIVCGLIVCVDRAKVKWSRARGASRTGPYALFVTVRVGDEAVMRRAIVWFRIFRLFCLKTFSMLASEREMALCSLQRLTEVWCPVLSVVH